MTDDPYFEHYVDEDGNNRVRRRDGDEVCDFCLAPNPSWDYPVGEMRIDGHPVVNRSDDGWGACDECRALIDAKNIGGLVERCVSMQPVHEPPSELVHYPPLPIARRHARTNIMRFFNARLGPPTRV